MATPLTQLTTWIQRDCTGDLEWFSEQVRKVSEEGYRSRALYTSIGLVPRKLGKSDLQLTKADLATADTLCSGWDPTGYSVDMAGRLVLILSAYDESEGFFEAFDTLWRTADVGEQVAFYRGLPLYPNPEKFLWRATDGCRTNIKGVFEAIAHRNPYPAEHFDEVAFNQLCLKALFVGSELNLIQNLDDRHNSALARMMTDYAFERWAASRVVSPELWRCVGAYPDERCLDALERALDGEEPNTRDAAALACLHSPTEAARALLANREALKHRAESGEVTWSGLAAAFSA